MSDSGSPAAGRYQRSTGGLVGAMVVTVLAVGGYAGVRALTDQNQSTPVQAVDYHAMERSGRADHKLLVMAPPSLPRGWKATSADYETGTDPTWHLGVLTDEGNYVGVEEALGGVQDLVEKYVDPNAAHGKDVTVGGQVWQTWTDKDGDYALSRSQLMGSHVYETWLVVGSAPNATIRDYAASLRGGTIHAAG
jgi:hypothetical protein